MTWLVGVGLTALVSLIGGLVGGAEGAVAAASFGALATAIQAVAGRLMRGEAGSGVWGPSSTAWFLRRWGVGVALRVGGVGVFAVVVAVWPERFPPLFAALGYVGVLLPLLGLELRTMRVNASG